ncbi:unnamed protein product [Leptidea sinapis]|uniref:Uncharacterized protein n=1 Tax=Leptidea sinapis TaxID=189913 RepID=A0A5E4R4Q7_9NEOP|nr:unnamed protein product [Leptidea sinapis]
MEESLTPSILVNGFRKCGLVPWNPEAVTIPGKAIEKKDNTEKILFLKRGLHFLNESIPADTLIVFQSTIGDWSGDTTDKSLFNLWHSTKTEVEALQKKDSDLTQEDRTASPLTADFNIPAPISDLATADMELDTKRKPKEKLPTVAFGEDYVIYLKRKMEKKENLAKQKLERANERKRKKAEKDALMEQKKLEGEDRKRRKFQDTQAKKTRRHLCYSCLLTQVLKSHSSSRKRH